jgi:hypothetical protein
LVACNLVGWGTLNRVIPHAVGRFGPFSSGESSQEVGRNLAGLAMHRIDIVVSSSPTGVVPSGDAHEDVVPVGEVARDTRESGSGGSVLREEAPEAVDLIVDTHFTQCLPV